MMVQSESEKVYCERMLVFKSELVTVENAYRKISWLRVAAFFLGNGCAIFLFVHYHIGYSLIVFLVTQIVFFALVIRHAQIRQRRIFIEKMYKINSESSERVHRNWHQFEQIGNEFCDVSHPYAVDLDLFGSRSVYQWICAANTSLGKSALAQMLGGNVSLDEAMRRQNGVRELADEIDWRQKFQADGMLDAGEYPDCNRLFLWAENFERLLPSPFWKWFIKIFPCVTVLFFICASVFSGIFALAGALNLLIQLGILYHFQKKLSVTFSMAETQCEALNSYREMLLDIEQKKWTSELLVSLSSRLQGENSAAECIKKLSGIVDRINLRHSGLVHFILNLIFMWDLHCALSLDRWRRIYGNKLREWLGVVGTFEAYSSVSLFAFDERGWCWPKFNDYQNYHIEAIGLGHPLIAPDKRVYNDFILNGKSSLVVLTGSNMSGKSTMLRSIGLALVLAYAGAPVCAQDFCAGELHLYTSMRLRDDVDANISSFYAELLRIKTIIEAAKTGKPLIFLIDEIFRGTNSLDRIAGARTALRHLCLLGASGLVTTHDLELAALENLTELNARNFHFQEHYENDKIVFDYKLLPGVSVSSNARYLMKLVGIDSDD